MIKDNKINECLYKMSEELSLPTKEIERMIDSIGSFIRNTTHNINAKELTLEQFDNTKKNFNIPGLGKLYTSRKRFIQINKIDKVDEEGN